MARRRSAHARVYRRSRTRQLFSCNAARVHRWSPFFHTWGLKGIYPRILEDERQGVEAKKVFVDGNALLDRIVAENLITARGVYGLFPANAVGDDVELYTDSTRENCADAIPLSPPASQPRGQRALPLSRRLHRPEGDRAARSHWRVRCHQRYLPQGVVRALQGR